MAIVDVQDLPATGKLLTLDVGEKWVGLALSNSAQTLASPRPALLRGKWQDDQNFFLDLVKKEAIVGLISGLPLTLKGDVGPAADAARSYAQLVEALTGLPLAMWDERLTTAAAERSLFEQRVGRQTRASKKEVKSRADSAAAVLILQGALDLKAGQLIGR